MPDKTRQRRVRTGAKKSFFDRAQAIFFSGRKTFETKATFVGVMVLGGISATGLTTSLLAPELIGQQRGVDQVITGGFASVSLYFMTKVAQDMTRSWYIIEPGSAQGGRK
tara:strand:+ start:949 stop:1278 length:330 start_codon:yes stop_codon:yes gene_type:complete